MFSTSIARSVISAGASSFLRSLITTQEHASRIASKAISSRFRPLNDAATIHRLCVSTSMRIDAFTFLLVVATAVFRRRGFVLSTVLVSNLGVARARELQLRGPFFI